MSRYIDADWLLNFFEPYPNDYQTPLGSLRACVDDAPSIDIEPKRGRWIPVDNGHHVRCSECGRCGFACDNFCSNCGADMRGAENE